MRVIRSPNTNQADLVIHVDNKPATATLKVATPMTDEECGVVEWTDSLSLDLDDPNTTKGLLAELNETCAFAFELTASAHVRNGDGWIGPKARDRVAIAVEKSG